MAKPDKGGSVLLTAVEYEELLQEKLWSESLAEAGVATWSKHKDAVAIFKAKLAAEQEVHDWRGAVIEVDGSVVAFLNGSILECRVDEIRDQDRVTVSPVKANRACGMAKVALSADQLTVLPGVSYPAITSNIKKTL